MRVEVVGPQEEPRVSHAVEPLDRGIGHGLGIALSVLELRCRSWSREVILVEVKAFAQTIPGGQHVGAQHRTGCVVVSLQDFRKRDCILVERSSPVVSDLVPERIESGQDRGVGRQGERRGRVARLEPDAVSRHLIDRGRLRMLRAVTPQMVRSCRIERHEHHVPVDLCIVHPRPPIPRTPVDDSDPEGDNQDQQKHHNRPPTHPPPPARGFACRGRHDSPSPSTAVGAGGVGGVGGDSSRSAASSEKSGAAAGRRPPAALYWSNT